MPQIRPHAHDWKKETKSYYRCKVCHAVGIKIAGLALRHPKSKNENILPFKCSRDGCSNAAVVRERHPVKTVKRNGWHCAEHRQEKPEIPKPKGRLF